MHDVSRCCSSVGVDDDHDSRSSVWSVAVGPTMTREANTGPEGLPTHWANLGRGCTCCSVHVGGGRTGVARHTFLLRLSSASLLSGTDTCEYFAMPGCVVGSELLPIANVDVQVLEGSFDAVFVVFRLPSDGSLAFTQFSIQWLFGQSHIELMVYGT